jgi:hypothetical protein
MPCSKINVLRLRSATTLLPWYLARTPLSAVYVGRYTAISLLPMALYFWGIRYQLYIYALECTMWHSPVLPNPSLRQILKC